MLRRSMVVVFTALFALSGAGVLQAQVQNERSKGKQLLFESYEAAYFQGEDVRSRATMEIVDGQDRTRTRSLTILRKNTGDHSQRYYAYFHEPSRLRGMVFMTWTNPGQDDDRWLYMPSIDVVQRITGNQKRNSFAGSDFTYEDMTGRYPNNDKAEYVGKEKLGGRTVHVVKGTPKNPDMVEFANYRVYIDTDTKLPVKSVFYTARGDKHHTITIEKTRTIQEHPTPVVQKSVNHRTGSTTTTTMDDVEYNNDIPKRVFEKRYLQRPPTPWVRP